MSKQIQYKKLSVSGFITKDASGKFMIEGYANTPSKDRVGDVVFPKAFEKTLEVYKRNPVLLLNHDWNDVIGRCTEVEVTDKGLYVKALISDTRTDIKTLIKEKCYSTFSIGYNEVDADYDEATKTKYIKELELLEISIVSVPANTEAMFTEIEEKAEVEAEQKQEVVSKPAKSYKEFITNIKSIVGEEQFVKSFDSIMEYLTTNEELMTKEQLLAALSVKSLPETKTEEVKQEAQATQDDIMKAIAAKLDALAEAMKQILDKFAQEPAKEEAKEEEMDKEVEEQKSEEEKECEDKEQEMDKEEDEEEEMSDEEIEKQLQEIEKQLVNMNVSSIGNDKE